MEKFKIEEITEQCEKEIEELFDFDFEFYKVFFDPVRIEIIKYLSIHGAKNIGEIAENFPQDRSVISRHLALMYKQGILNKRKEARYTIYEIECKEIQKKFEETAKKLKKIIT